MELVTRQDAVSKGLGRYFTGKPCKHGHVTQRFTSSSGCIECVHPTFVNLEWQQRRADALQKRQEKEDQRNIRERLAHVTARMVPIFILLNPEDLAVFRAFALAAAMMHEPTLTQSQIETRYKPKYWGSRLRYTFMCFPGDEPTLRDFQDSLDMARRPTVPVNSASAQARLDAVLAAVNAEADRNWPEFKP